MNSQTLNSIENLLAMIKALPTRPSPKEVGSLDAQAQLVRIDLEVFEGAKLEL